MLFILTARRVLSWTHAPVNMIIRLDGGGGLFSLVCCKASIINTEYITWRTFPSWSKFRQFHYQGGNGQQKHIIPSIGLKEPCLLAIDTAIVRFAATAGPKSIFCPPTAKRAINYDFPLAMMFLKYLILSWRINLASELFL